MVLDGAIQCHYLHVMNRLLFSVGSQYNYMWFSVEIITFIIFIYVHLIMEHLSSGLTYQTHVRTGAVVSRLWLGF